MARRAAPRFLEFNETFFKQSLLKDAGHILNGLDLSIDFFNSMDLSNIPTGCQNLSKIYENFTKITSACCNNFLVKETDRKQIDEKLTELFSVINKMAKSKEYAIFLEHHAYILSKSQKFQEALPILYKSLYFFEKQNNQNAQAKCLYSIGLVHKKLDNHDMAMTTFEHILRVFDPNNLNEEGKRCRLSSQYELATYNLEGSQLDEFQYYALILMSIVNYQLDHKQFLKKYFKILLQPKPRFEAIALGFTKFLNEPNVLDFFKVVNDYWPKVSFTSKKEIQKNWRLFKNSAFINSHVRCILLKAEATKKKAIEEAQSKEEAKKKAKEQAQLKVEAKKKAEEEAHLKAEAKNKATLVAQIEAEAKKKATLEAQIEVEATKKAKEQAEAKKKAAEEAKKKAKEQADAMKKAAEDQLNGKKIMENLQQNLEMQLTEIELLQSMYSEEELKFHDNSTIEEIENWIKHPKDELPSTISFVLKLDKFQASISFPHAYPGDMCAEVMIHCDIKRDVKSKLNKDLDIFMKQMYVPDCAIVTEVISWLQENMEVYFVQNQQGKAGDSKKEFTQGPIVAGRLWLYIHHIYSKNKRKNILDLARDHSLSGFCMPGKPGIVCLEGPLQECNDVWSEIRQDIWKKINIKFQEEENLNNMEELKTWRKFDRFEEIGFVKGETEDFHMDMGEFNKFLQTHKCDYMFKELFGIDKS